MRQRRHWTAVVAGTVLVAAAACGSDATHSPEPAGALRGSATSARSVPRTVALRVPGMFCSRCARSIEVRLTEAGLREVSIDLDTKIVTARFDPRRFDEEDIAALVEGAGFRVDKSEVVSHGSR